ncbi:MAG: SIS domain-containing protein [Tissierellia bacterium]|nr:SIS domain-containing protein [Tissierellia bacterium]
MFLLKNQSVKYEEYKNTLSEILHQPNIWKEAHKNYIEQKTDIEKFLSSIRSKHAGKMRVIFTGAGTSEYVGNIIVDYLRKNDDYQFESISTTDIVSNPYLYLKRNTPTLLVSFARSGNSPESLAAVEICSKLIDNFYNLAITCADNGKLANSLYGKENSYVLIMPDGSNDKGFAMTSSFTSMMLSALLIFDNRSDEEKLKIVEFLIDSVNSIIKREKELTELIDFDFERIVYIGSGTLSKLVNECRLKILELTAGQVVTCHESSMGFRHGPKSFVNDKTFIVSLVSNNEYTAKYDIDILNEVYHDEIAKNILAISTSKIDSGFEQFTIDAPANLEDVYLSFPYVFIAQIISLLTCNRVGNSADSPSRSGTVNRVVKGVVIHEL